MPETDLDAAREFFERAAQAPLLQHVGELIDDPNVEIVKNWDQALAAMQQRTWLDLENRTNNHFRNKVVANWGMPWYQAHYRTSWHAVSELFPAPIKNVISEYQSVHNLSGSIGEEICGDILQIGLEYAFGEARPACFCRVYLEKWILSGHLPCGWKGRLPREPRNLGVCELSAVVGEGRLIVY